MVCTEVTWGSFQTSSLELRRVLQLSSTQQASGTCLTHVPDWLPYVVHTNHPPNQSYIDIFRCGHLVCIPAADWLLWRPPPPKLCRRITHALDLMNSLWPESLTTCGFLWIWRHNVQNLQHLILCGRPCPASLPIWLGAGTRVPTWAGAEKR